MRPFILKTGTTVASLRPRRGDFENWIADAADIPFEACTVFDAMRRDDYPEPGELDAIFVTGSASSVHDRDPWSERAASWLRDAHDQNTPILGICYGHQLLAHALGGQSGQNPKGREIGVHEVELIEDDPLMEGLPKTMPVFETHVDVVLAPPEGTRVLARNDNNAYQALSFGPRCRSVQWHPEFDDDIIRAYIQERRGLIDEELGQGSSDRLLQNVRPISHGSRLIKNFIASFVG